MIETRVGYAAVDALARLQDQYIRDYYQLTGQVRNEDIIKYDELRMFLADMKTDNIITPDRG